MLFGGYSGALLRTWCICAVQCRRLRLFLRKCGALCRYIALLRIYKALLRTWGICAVQSRRLRSLLRKCGALFRTCRALLRIWCIPTAQSRRLRSFLRKYGAFLHVYRAPFGTCRALLRIWYIYAAQRRRRKSLCGNLGLFCMYVGLFFEYVGLFCGMVHILRQNIVGRLSCGYLGLFCGYIRLFCGGYIRLFCVYPGASCEYHGGKIPMQERSASDSTGKIVVYILYQDLLWISTFDQTVNLLKTIKNPNFKWPCEGCDSFASSRFSGDGEEAWLKMPSSPTAAT